MKKSLLTLVSLFLLLSGSSYAVAGNSDITTTTVKWTVENPTHDWQSSRKKSAKNIDWRAKKVKNSWQAEKESSGDIVEWFTDEGRKI
ncbi:MAG: hypothetical protein Q9M31_01285 [Mariprofundus sp.]|nr:hypothetical protein [Mariprofundus sp.]